MIVLIAVVTFAVYSTITNVEKVNQASKSDVKFVFNWGGLNPAQEYEIISSYDSPSHFLGDYIQHICIQASEFNPKIPKDWVAGPEQNELFQEARETFASTGKMNECFGQGVSPSDSSVYMYIFRFRGKRNFITGAEIIFFHETSKRILFIGVET